MFSHNEPYVACTAHIRKHNKKYCSRYKFKVGLINKILLYLCLGCICACMARQFAPMSERNNKFKLIHLSDLNKDFEYLAESIKIL